MEDSSNRREQLFFPDPQLAVAVAECPTFVARALTNHHPPRLVVIMGEMWPVFAPSGQVSVTAFWGGFLCACETVVNAATSVRLISVV